MPHTRAMGGGLFELRIKAAEGIARVFYCTVVSAIARLESAEPKHSPSIATLQKYAKALGYTVQVNW